MNIHNEKILILDFGSQVTQLIARRVREFNVYCEIHSYDVSDDFIREFAPKGIILSGGPNSVYETDTPSAPSVIFELGVPIFGICYGMQTIAKQLGGEVASSGKREFGYAEIHDLGSQLFAGLSDGVGASGNFLQVWMSHGDKVVRIPDGFEVIAKTESCPIAAMYNPERNIYAVQFHPEVTHTKQGTRILEHFVRNVCRSAATWTMPSYADDAIASIKEKVGSDQVVLALSGGVDSSVAGVLIHKAIGTQLVCIFVDTGLLRLNEADQVMQNYAENLDLNIIKIDAKDEFYAALAGISDPEQKRKIIGKLFVDIFQREAAKLSNARWLAQGTIYPDVIESAGSKTNKAHNIKSHHNVGGLPESLNLQLLEPLRELFKDEVRSLGVSLGIAPKLIYRHPFPGPGLGVRILGDIRAEFVTLLQHADNIFIEELYSHDLYHKVAQAFVVFMPVKTVGVMGDGRTYDYAVSLRAVETTDFMTANVANLPFEFITKVANRIINEVKGVNRVVYDISGKPPATIEWE